MSPDEYRMIDFPKLIDSRGSLSFIENKGLIPFEIRRVFYLYEIPIGASRGGHALKRCQQLLIAISGCFEIILDDGSMKLTRCLNRPDQGLYVPPMIWREMANFSPGAVCLALASEPFDAEDYYRSYADFIRALGRPGR